MVNLTIPNAFKVTYEQFQQLARVNRDWRLERTATGELVSTPPTGSITGNRNNVSQHHQLARVVA